MEELKAQHPTVPDLTIYADGRVFNHAKWKDVPLYQRPDGRYVFDYKRKRYYIHRLLAELFIPNPDGHRIVCFLDGDPTNYQLSNLAWRQHANPNAESNLKRGGNYVPLIAVKENGEEEIFRSFQEAEAQGYSRTGIRQSITMGCRHRGRMWRYAKKYELIMHRIDTTGLWIRG